MKLALILPILITTTALAGERLLDSETITIPGIPESAALEVRIQQKELLYDFMEGKPSYITKMIAKVEVNDSQDLPKYGVVQFIHGCRFKSQQSEDGTITYGSDGSSRQFFDKQVPFRHPKWVIDSVDKDPLYSSGTAKQGRLGPYRLDDPMTSQDPRDQLFFSRDFTNQTQFFVRDMPSGANENYDGFINTSLEFRTCLYRLSDLPKETSPEGLEILGKELGCVSWKSNFIYDHSKKEYAVGKDIHPYCLQSTI